MKFFAKHQVLSHDVLATSHVWTEKYEQRLEDLTRRTKKLLYKNHFFDCFTPISMSIIKPNNKFVSLLLSLDRKEIEAFRKFLNSPYFNQKEEIVTAFDFITRRKTALQKSKVTREAVFAAAYPTSSFHAARCNKLFYQLHQLLEQFLTVSGLQQDAVQRNQLLLKELTHRTSLNLFTKQLEHTQAILQKMPTGDGQYFLEQFQLKQTLFNHPDFNGGGKTGDENVAQNIEYLDHAYLFYRIKMECERISRNRIYASNAHFPSTRALLDYVAQSAIKLPPTVSIYYGILELFMEHHDQGKFADLYKNFVQYQAMYSTIEAASVLQLLLNYSYYQINQSELSFLPILLQLFRFGLQEKLLMPYGYLTDITFSNIVSASLANGEKEWAADFIKDYQNQIIATHRQDAYHLAMANLYYHQHQFLTASTLLNIINYRLIPYQIRARVLDLKLRFEDQLSNNPQLSDNLAATIDTVLRWLFDQKKIFAAQKLDKYKNFCRALKKLNDYRLHPYPSTTDYEQLSKDVKQNFPCLAQDWVQRQLLDLVRVK